MSADVLRRSGPSTNWHCDASLVRTLPAVACLQTKLHSYIDLLWTCRLVQQAVQRLHVVDLLQAFDFRGLVEVVCNLMYSALYNKSATNESSGVCA